jgi:prophage regulatory protein
MSHPYLQIDRVSDVSAKSGYPRSTLYARISQGLWTRPIKLGVRASGWPAYETEALNAARVAGKSDAEIRSLVTRLEKDRRNAIAPQCDPVAA